MDFTQEQLEQIIQAQFSDVTPELQEYILSNDVLETVAGICETYEVSESENTVHNDVTLMLLGIISPEGLPERLQEETGLAPEKANEMATDIFSVILEEYLGLIPTELSPSAEEIIGEDDAPEEPKESPILQATRTMQGDIAEAQGDDTPQWRTVEEGEESGVEKKENEDLIPRYSKPLTDTPKYE